ncbi:flagellar hook-length control protein FliK [Sphingomonas rubra]|uniref:flagellar hook-length control protein FliK n=1 Tax=Sphingomonas rubra TaxID=634430 RepID=UPI0015A551FF|nr:flagellar hook-length control protein FliK [Sphingomonas rubra]
MAPVPTRSAPAVAPLPAPAPIPTAAPAGIVFGAARFAAQTADDRDEPALPIGLAPLAAAPLERPAAAAPPPQAPIDVTQERWPHTMIERIEMIRDAANEVDTRIRLVPDALGAIDVDVRRDGDTLHVRFQADQPQTRALLADAAPRLAEAAEARGLRLGQSSVGGGQGDGTAGQGQQQQRSPVPTAPPRAPLSPTAAGLADDDDTRLA